MEFKILVYTGNIEYQMHWGLFHKKMYTKILFKSKLLW